MTNSTAATTREATTKSTWHSAKWNTMFIIMKKFGTRYRINCPKMKKKYSKQKSMLIDVFFSF